MRSPVVAIIGHIDHGKSTLLDYIRKTKVTEKEAGGITQHVSAYEAETGEGKDKKKITFLDTPGHEAFFNIRERGSRMADICILVVSAEDGVKPQTIEAIKYLKKEDTPYIVAINKIDRPGANIDKTKQSLAENEVLVEGYGGTIPAVPISAKTGENIEELLEMILLQAELMDLQGDEKASAEGFIIESNLNPKKGVEATLLIKNGSLSVGDFVATSGSFAPIRMIENFAGKNIPIASFSSPIKIVGWNNIPEAGTKFVSFKNKKDAEDFASHTKVDTGMNNQKDDGSIAFFPVVIKTDTLGSLEAIKHELEKLGNEKIKVKIIYSGIGTINEKDIKTASIGSKSIIIGFNVSGDKNALTLAQRDGLEIKTYSIIYDLVDFLKDKVNDATPETQEEREMGIAKILKSFSKNKDKQVLGGRVEEGEIKNGAIVKIYRRDNLIGDGKIKEMQSQKIKTDRVEKGTEFGMMIDSKVEIVPGDFIKYITTATVK